MLDQLPPEICALIFVFACRDSGHTGRSLSLVSRYIHETSKIAKLQSIVLVGRAQILAFARLLDQIPAHLRTTRYLFINGHENEEEMTKIIRFAYAGSHKAQCELSALPPGDERLNELQEEMERQQAKTHQWLEDFGREGASAIQSILLNLAPTLKLLDLALNKYVAEMMKEKISLPRLVDLTSRCGFPLHATDDPVLEPSHFLLHVHIVEPADLWTSTTRFFENGISHFAPSLTHLRLSQLGEDESVITHLESALGLSDPIYKVTQLPSTLELVLLKPAVAPETWEGCGCCDDTLSYYDLVNDARRLRDMDHRLVLLQADDTHPENDPCFQEWMDKVDGAACDWDTSNMDMAVYSDD
ncbi:hypothetical protein B0H13DRAFT_1745130 [Mycena leptocephala]|nr:hypothetical protein B0H13DRAFT_1745130 [Mycena leptocephala]